MALGFLLLLAWDLYQVRSDLRAGEESLDSLTLEAVAAHGLSGLATDASDHLSAAHDRARSSIPLRALSALPVFGDQVAGIRRLTAATADLGSAGARSAERIDEALQGAGQPAGRVELLDIAIEELDGIAHTLDGIDLGDDTDLVGPLAAAHRDLEDTIQRARHKLEDGQDLVQPVRDLFVGPSSFLLLAANNAEMAGGSGLALSAGIMTFDGGEIELGEVVNAGELRLRDGIDLPGDLHEIYRPTGIGVDFRSSTRSPNLPLMGPVIDEMTSHLDPNALGRSDIDGVIIVDAIALRDLLQLTGPVVVGDTEVTHENVLAEVLYENYLTFGTTAERDERVSYQGDIAKAAFDALTERDVPAAELASGLVDSSRGRHLMAWSEDDDLQHVWSELGVAGELDPLGLMVSFQNYSANKLDWFLRPSAELDVDVLPSGDYRAHLTVRMPVPSLEELGKVTPYILGPNPELQGLFVTAHLPEAAYDISTPDERGFRTAGVDGPMQVRTFLADVPLGTTFERQINFSLPRRVSALLVLPSGRLEPTPITVDRVATVDDRQPTVISWLAAGVPDHDGGRVPDLVRVLVALGAAAAVVAVLAIAWGTRRPAITIGPWRSNDVAQATAMLALVTFALAGVVALMLATPRV